MTDTQRLVSRLKAALKGPLPGPSAQHRMAPSSRQIKAKPNGQTRQSAVLAIMHPTEYGAAMIFTLRPKTLRHHGGQISFPGGGVEPQDGSYVEAALREAEEELGITTDEVEILGKMTTLYIAPSENLVHPYVGWLPDLPPLDPDPIEVAGVVSVPIAQLLSSASRGVHHWRRNGRRFTAPCYLIDDANVVKYPSGEELWRDVSIWGATAMMLSEMLAVIREEQRRLN